MKVITKTVTKYALLFILCLACLLGMSAFSPMPQAGTIPIAGTNFLDAATFVMFVFATMTGIPLLIAAIVNLLKVFLVGASWVASQITQKPVVLTINNYSNQIAAVLNIAAFVALVYFRVFQPVTSFDWIDGQAKQVAELLNYVAVLFGQLAFKSYAYGLLRGQVPILGYSYSK